MNGVLFLLQRYFSAELVTTTAAVSALIFTGSTESVSLHIPFTDGVSAGAFSPLG